MKPLPICYCRKTHYGQWAHLHEGESALDPSPTAMALEIRRLRPYERAVVRWCREDTKSGDHWPTARPVVLTLHRLAAASVRRSKEVRRG